PSRAGAGAPAPRPRGERRHLGKQRGLRRASPVPAAAVRAVRAGALGLPSHAAPSVAAAGRREGQLGDDVGVKERLAFYLGFFFGGLWFFLCSALGVVWLLLRPGNRQTLYVY